MSFVKDIILGLAYIGGFGITQDLLMAVSKKEIYYRCPKCDERIRKRQKYCCECGINLDWSELDKNTINN